MAGPPQAPQRDIFLPRAVATRTRTFRPAGPAGRSRIRIECLPIALVARVVWRRRCANLWACTRAT
eukprot:14307774-Alexandrium_andersonii.AAC.1